ncbi:hypothetical protein [Spirulina sp. 06S082]|uniref:hypothetical protein n=1 Tax=Spirulina sp. 06S082 TaxID=3110248 RepID=UPI002B1F2E4A|nr:hypothetical protein [Spirulina sp. 06S082]MEA5468406.1 hypothetical protein [Spirulina sp. 06S082]
MGNLLKIKFYCCSLNLKPRGACPFDRSCREQFLHNLIIILQYCCNAIAPAMVTA